MKMPPQCVFCKHLIDSEQCQAFPFGIPREIYPLGKFDHTKPYPSDNGIRFEAKNDAPKWVLEAWGNRTM